jgi:hypothetical protein
MAFSDRSASSEPCREASVYITAPKKMKRSTCECLRTLKWPFSVRCWLIENAATGMIIITLCTID